MWLKQLRAFSYQGALVHGKRQGQGVQTFTSGAVRMYEGMWNDDCMHGQGVLHFANGFKYQGEFNKGYQHGMGTLEYLNGSRYEGQWAQNMMEG